MVVLALGVGLGWPGSAGRLQAAPTTGQSGPAQTVPPLDADLTPLTSKNIVGHRLWLIVFDKTAMQIADIQRALAQATTWTAEKTPNVDVVAVAVVGSTGLELLQDFTSNDAKLRRALTSFGNEPMDGGSARMNAEAPDLGELTNDQRLTGLKTICEALKPWPDRKEMLYFSVSPATGGGDNALQYRDAINACEKAHVAIDTIDPRGLSPFGRGASNRGGAAAGVRGTVPSATRPASAAPPATLAQLAGTWTCANACASSLVHSAVAVWLSPTFTLTPDGSTIALSGGASGRFTWTFSPTGPSTNPTALPGAWTSTMSWDADTLVLALAGVVDEAGTGTPVVVKQVLALIQDGPDKGQLRVTTTVTPDGALPAGVSVYRKGGELARPRSAAISALKSAGSGAS